MTIMSVGNPLFRKGGSQALRQTCLCLNAEGRFRHKHSSLIYLLPEWVVAEAPLRFKIQKGGPNMIRQNCHTPSTDARG